MSISRDNCVTEKNTCVNYYKGFCIKCGTNCPSVIKYDDANNNNAPCDMVGYVPVKMSNINA